MTNNITKFLKTRINCFIPYIKYILKQMPYILYLIILYIFLTYFLYLFFSNHLLTNNIKINQTIKVILLTISSFITMNMISVYILITNLLNIKNKVNILLQKLTINSIIIINMLYIIIITIVLYKLHSCQYYKYIILTIHIYSIEFPIVIIIMPLVYFLGNNLIIINSSKKNIHISNNSKYYYDSLIMGIVALINISFILFILLSLFAHKVIILNINNIVILQTDDSLNWFLDYLDKAYIDFCKKKDPISDILLDHFLIIDKDTKILWFNDWSKVSRQVCISNNNINIDPQCYKYNIINEYLNSRFENYYKEKHNKYIQKLSKSIF